jgi:hypothetical protein
VEGFGKGDEEGRGRKLALGRVKRIGQILPHLRGRRFQPALPPCLSFSLPPSLSFSLPPSPLPPYLPPSLPCPVTSS